MTTLTRRDLLLGLGGGAAGVALTPVPWKLLDDVSIWSQHRQALPIPPKGEVSFKPAACTLCPGGCALRARCVGRRTVSLVAEAKHPLGAGACALGLTLHHLAYHPLRLAAPARRVDGRLQHVAPDDAVATLAAAIARAGQAGQAVMVIDRRPGRVASQAWGELLSGLQNGLYVTLPGEEGTLAALQGALAEPAALGIDLERTRTLLSFGAPVLDGWGRPGRVRAARRQLRVVQLDSWRSPTAALADEWLSIAPGAEGPLALALAHVIVKDDESRVPADVRSALAPFSPARVAPRTGVEAARIEALARAAVAGAPTVAIGGGEAGAGPLGADAERAIALLNVTLGSVQREGGFVPRRPLPEPAVAPASATLATLDSVPRGSVGVAILDAADDGRALPWSALAPALAKNALLVSLSPFEGGLARQATLLVPAPAPLESWDEVLPAPDAAVASYALAAPLLTPPAVALDAVALVTKLGAVLQLAVGAGSHEERLKQRVAAIHGAARGRFVAREASGYADTAAADAAAAWDVLAQGGCWIDEPQPPSGSVRTVLPSAAALARWAQPDVPAADLALVAFAGRACAGQTPVSPLLSKLYQESDLRPSTRVVAVHPKTAEVLGLRDGRRVWIESAAGRVLAELHCDATLPPGRLALAAGPAPEALHPGTRWGAEMNGALALVAVGEDGSWRGTRVRVREA